MDYNFVTIDRFMELEKSGALLESGTYEGKDLFKTRLITRMIAAILLCDISIFFLRNVCFSVALWVVFSSLNEWGSSPHVHTLPPHLQVCFHLSIFWLYGDESEI